MYQKITILLSTCAVVFFTICVVSTTTMEANSDFTHDIMALLGLVSLAASVLALGMISYDYLLKHERMTRRALATCILLASVPPVAFLGAGIWSIKAKTTRANKIRISPDS